MLFFSLRLCFIIIRKFSHHTPRRMTHSTNNSTATTATVIIPAARDGPAPSLKPCWLRQHPGGQLVIHHLIRALDLTAVSRIVIVASAAHISKWLCGDVGAMVRHLTGCEDLWKRASGTGTAPPPPPPALEILSLEHETSSAAATVAFAIREANITGSIFIKDQDSCFDHRVVPGANYVVGLRLTERAEVDNIPGKSFLQTTGALLSSIVEKQVVSDVIGVGGYAFQSAEEFLKTLEAVEEVQVRVAANLKGTSDFSSSAAAAAASAASPPRSSASSSTCTSPSASSSSHHRLFLSHIVQYQMLHEEKVFAVDFCAMFCDWKSEEAWRRFVSKYRNVTIALEGVLFEPKHPDDVVGTLFSRNEDLVPVTSSIRYLNSLPRLRTRIVVTTSRSSNREAETRSLLEAHGVPCDGLICGTLLASTYIVASYGERTLQHPSAVAVNVPEHSNQLLSSLMH